MEGRESNHYGSAMGWLIPAVLIALLCFRAVYPQPAEPSSDRADPSFYSENEDLTGYVKEALKQSPVVLGALARYRSALQKVPQVDALPDPMLMYSQFFRGDRVNVLEFSQMFPWFGKLDLQGQIAVKEAAAMLEEYRAMQLDLAAEIKRTYFDLYYLDRAIDINRAEQSLLGHYEALARSRYASGQGLQQEVIKIQTELSRLIDMNVMLKQERDAAAARLNALMNRPVDGPIPRTGEVGLPTADPDLKELYALGERNRPELRGSLALLERGRQKVALAKKSYWPDLTIGAGVMNMRDMGLPDSGMGLPAAGQTSYAVSVGINIPLWFRKYHAGVLEATEGILAEQENYDARLTEMKGTIRQKVLRLDALKRQLELYDRVMIPQAEESLKASEAAYETGELAALDLLDSERLLLEIRLGRIRYRTDYMVALTDLERALGTKYPQ